VSYPTSLSFDMYRCPPMLGADCRKNWTACGAIFSLRSVHLGLFAAAFENCKIIDATNWLNCFWFVGRTNCPNSGRRLSCGAVKRSEQVCPACISCALRVLVTNAVIRARSVSIRRSSFSHGGAVRRSKDLSAEVVAYTKARYTRTRLAGKHCCGLQAIGKESLGGSVSRVS
jgi:hypothetical protein